MKQGKVRRPEAAQDSVLAPGVALELVVARIQQMMDPNSVVTHNETLEDRVGNNRQYDVVIRGQFGGRPVLGVMECKDHSRRKGPDAVEAFAKKTENLGANLRLMVSKKGFTDQALKLAKHENIGCLSLLPADPKQVGFSIGDMWYGLVSKWTNVRLTVHFGVSPAPVTEFASGSVKWAGKPVISWFLRELFTTYAEMTEEGEHGFQLMFSAPRELEVSGEKHPVLGITCLANRIYRKKRKWVNWSGDAFYDWNEKRLTIPASGTLVGSAVETDLGAWQDYEGEIPKPEEEYARGIIRGVLYDTQKWDPSQDRDVPDLTCL